ncbi:MAG: substrate-binding domain-containing protein, partial [Sphingobacterium siyangense]
NYEINTYKIGIDNFKVVYQGISQLINQGKRKILFISNQSRGTSLERQRGYIQCLRDFDITFNSNDLLSIETNRKRVDVLDQLKNHLTGLVDSRALPEAIFTASDQLTYLTLEALHAIGITVPERIALLGFANFQYTTIFQPSLSSVVQPSREIGSQAFAILNKILDSPDHKITTQYQNIELQASILTRKSSE